MAELIDNAVDAFAEADRAGILLDEKTITVSWSGDSVAASDRTIEVIDTGVGMTLEQVQNAVRAGYSSNNPIQNLGLFGMGFNIATARLGGRTRLLSSKQGDNSWFGIEIDFARLIQSGTFQAPVVIEPKAHSDNHGTKIVVSSLKEGIYAQLRDKESAIRRQIENIYAPLLDQVNVEMLFQGKKLVPKRHCVWAKTRYVTRNGERIPAVIEIDRDLGRALFDIERNAYLSRDEEASVRQQQSRGVEIPGNITERHKRLRGWIGIQRFSDPNDFGIDFIRNGRKILIANKGLFSYENPLTSTFTLEYPTELASTWGGRIVGEIHVDYLLPTYQKNDFDRTDPSWLETVEALRGIGPILPRQRKNMGYSDDNTSPMSLLANAYRRLDPGTKNLAVERSIARDFTERFRRGDPEYLSDDKWWQAAQEADRSKATRGAEASPEVDQGSSPSDDPDEYALLPSPNQTVVQTSPPPTTPPSSPPQAPQPPQVTSTLDTLITSSRQIVSWSGTYSYGHASGFQVKVWELTKHLILKNSESVPCAVFFDGIECDFVFNPRHPFLAQFPIDPRAMLAVYLAERFKARDSLADIGQTFLGIAQGKLQDVRIDRTGLQEKASEMFDRLREKMTLALSTKAVAVLNCIHESSGETEETVNAMLSNHKLIISFQERRAEGIESLQYVPPRTLIRLVERFPGELFDDQVFQAPYKRLILLDEKATERSRNESRDRIVSFLKDALWVLGQSGAATAAGRAKDELARCSHSINFLSQEMAD